LIRFTTFIIPTYHRSITTSICCPGKPLLPPATFATMKTIKVLLRSSLAFNPLLGS
jgi:hypothetical protein